MGFEPTTFLLASSCGFLPPLRIFASLIDHMHLNNSHSPVGKLEVVSKTTASVTGDLIQRVPVL